MMAFFFISTHPWKTKSVWREIKKTRIDERSREEKAGERHSLIWPRKLSSSRKRQQQFYFANFPSSESPAPSTGPWSWVIQGRKGSTGPLLHAFINMFNETMGQPCQITQSCLSPNVTTQYFPTSLCDPSDETTISNSTGRREQKEKHLASLVIAGMVYTAKFSGTMWPVQWNLKVKRKTASPLPK